MRLDGRRLVIDRGLPVGGLGAENAVEAIKAQPRGPAIEGPRGALLPGRRQVPLSKAPRAIALALEQLGHGGRLPGNGAVVSGKAVGDLRYAAHVHAVVIPSGQQRRSSRGAERGGMKLVVAHPRRGHRINARGGDGSAKGAAGSKAHVIEHHEQHVRPPLAAFIELQGPGRRVLIQPRKAPLEGVGGLRNPHFSPPF